MGKPEIYKDEGYKLMGAAFEVYNEKGGGMAESSILARKRHSNGSVSFYPSSSNLKKLASISAD